MAFVDPNPWASSEAWDILLLPYVEAMSAAQLKRLGELMSRPILESPRDPYCLAHLWPYKPEVEQ